MEARRVRSGLLRGALAPHSCPPAFGLLLHFPRGQSPPQRQPPCVACPREQCTAMDLTPAAGQRAGRLSEGRRGAQPPGGLTAGQASWTCLGSAVRPQRAAGERREFRAHPRRRAPQGSRHVSADRPSCVRPVAPRSAPRHPPWRPGSPATRHPFAGDRNLSTIARAASEGGGVSRLTAMVTTKPSGTPKMPAEMGWMPHHSDTGDSTPNRPRSQGLVVAMYQKLRARPASMPAAAPHLLARCQKMPSTRAGKKAEAASEKAADTRNRMLAGFWAATNAAASATASRITLDSITRRAVLALGSAIWK